MDVVRSLLGEIDAVTATGDPPGEDPDLELVVQLRSPASLRAEVRIRQEPSPAIRISLLGSTGSLDLRIDSGDPDDATLFGRVGSQPERRIELPSWDRHEAIMALLTAAAGRRDPVADLPGPSLLDGTRAMELSEAVNRSLRRGRTVELHYEAISEDATFKSVMTSTGCLILLASLFVLPLSMIGPSVGMSWTLYIPALIPPALIGFLLLQSLRMAIRRPPRAETESSERPRSEPDRPTDSTD